MTNRKTLTIGIPAYNEQANIGYLIKELLDQDEDLYVLEKIIVNSDCSTDNTNKIVKEFSDTRVQLIENTCREGQGKKQNELIEKCNSDILVLLNADILINNVNFLNNITEEINNGADLVCGPLLEIKPHTFTERIIGFGSVYRRQVFDKYKNGNSLFTCHGSHRAFSKRLYKEFRFIGSVAEDAYSYLWCIKNGYTYAYTRKASVTIKLPSNIADHIKQSSRFFISGEKLSKYFDEDILNEHCKWPKYLFLIEGLKMFMFQPIEATCYVLISTYIIARNLLGLSDKTEAWNMVSSSKSLHTNI
jgi:glycosyltransferase involved in cell wall biosynthesis